MASLWAKDVVEAWKSQEGYECGENKWNKFADLLDRYDYFTGCGKKQNLDYCAVGLNWGVFVSIKYPNYEEDPEAAKWGSHYFLYQSDSCDMAAVVKYLYQYFADNGATTDNPERGDIAIFQKSNGVMYHCGGVTGWDDDYIYITEFNTEGGKVKTHAYKYSDIGGKIKCFCRPRYDGWEETSEEPAPDPEPTPEPAPEPTPEPTPAPAWTKKTVCVNTRLRVRSGPSTDYEIIGMLNNGDTVYVFEERDGWSKVDETKEQWVCSDYLK